MLLKSIFTVLWLSLVAVDAHEQSVLADPSQWTSSPFSWADSNTAASGQVSHKYAELDALLSNAAEVHVRGTEGYDDLTLRWQAYKEPDFDVVVAVATEEDLVATINYARSTDQQFLAVTSGHGVTSAMGQLKNAIQISLKNFKSVGIDQDGTTATIGGGLLAHELTRELLKHGKRAVVPVAECIGVVGPALGGGHSYLQGQHGLMADQIISARMVLWNGTVVSISATEHEDLFWGLKGAGHNFGIITEMQYKIYDMPADDHWSSETLIYGSGKLEEIFTYANRLLDEQPSNMIHFIYFPNIPNIDPEKPVIMVIAIINDTPEALGKFTEPLHKLDPIVATSSELPYQETPSFLAVKQSDVLCQKRSKTHASVNFPIDLYRYNVSIMRLVYDTLHQGQVDDPRLTGSVMLIEGFSVQGVQAIDEESTAVPFRRQRLLLSPAVIVPDVGNEQFWDKSMAWGRKIRELLRQGASDEERERPLSYVNYALGDEGSKSLYGHESWRQKKLAKLKQQWDPHNFFGSYGPIPLR